MPYQLLESQYLSDIRAEGKLYRHQKSGALVVTLSNDDSNKGMAIAFRTPPTNDKGIPHILEHSLLCGSDKFPLKDPFVQLIKGSLNTYLNAMTFSQFTVYPVSSPNSQDFQTLRDVYLDAVFAPQLRRCKEIFLQEGWHYEKSDKGWEFNGVVYNEMRGESSSEEFILANTMARELFPDTDARFVSGGLPEAIVELDYEELMEYYSRYYSPGNSILFFYGDMDMEKELRELDEEILSRFAYREAHHYLSQPALPERKVSYSFYPVSSEAEKEKGVTLSLGYVCADLCYVDQLLLLIIGQLVIYSESSFLRRRLMKEGLGESYDFAVDSTLHAPVLSITAHKCRREDVEKFEKVVEEELRQVVAHGFDKELIASVLHEMEYHFLAEDTDGEKAVNSILRLVERFAFERTNPFAALNTKEYLKELKEKCFAGYLEKLLTKYLLQNRHTAYIVLYPQTEWVVEEEGRLSAKQELRNASLSAEERKRLQKESEELRRYREKEDTAEDALCLPLLDREDLDEENEKERSEKAVFLGRETLYHEVDTNGIGYLNLHFDLGSFSQEELYYVSLLAKTIGYMDTRKYSYEELTKKISRKTGGIRFYTNTFETRNGKANPGIYLTAGLRYLPEESEEALGLWKEIVTSTIFEDEGRLGELIDELKANMEASFAYRGDRYARQWAARFLSLPALVEDIFSGRSFYRFLKKLNRQEALHKLQEISARVFVRERLFIDFAGNRALWQDSLNGLKDLPTAKQKEAKQSLQLPQYGNTLGLVESSGVQYCALVGKGRELSTEETAHFAVLSQILSTVYLWQNVRVLGGAYGADFQYSRGGLLSFTSYRDPHLDTTVAVFRRALDYIKNFKAGEREMRQYIIGTLSPFYTPRSRHRQASLWTRRYLCGGNEEEANALRKAIVYTQAKDIRALAIYVEEALKDSILVVVGNREKLLNSTSVEWIEEFL